MTRDVVESTLLYWEDLGSSLKYVIRVLILIV